MSNQSNTELLERAGEMMEYWTGTLHEKLIQKAIDDNDLEALAEHVALAEGECAQAVMHGYDVMPPSDPWGGIA